MHLRRLCAALAAPAAALALGAATAHADLVDRDPTTGAQSPSTSSTAPDVNPPADPNAAGDADRTTTGGAGSCTFKVKGKLVLRDPTLVDQAQDGDIQHDVLADNTPLEGVEVRVSGRSDPGWWNSWGSDYTDSDGNFSVSESQCNARVVKVEARFSNSELDVSGPDSPKWYLLYETTSAIDPSVIDLQREPFRGDSGDQSTSQARTDAQTWAVYQRAIDYVEGTGNRFDKQVVVHNPATLTRGSSATDPPTGAIHIDPTETNKVNVMLHELGHAWSYPYVLNEGCLTWDIMLDIGRDVIAGDKPGTHTTHDPVEKPCVAFEEGFAEFFARKLEYEMHGAGLLDTAPELADVNPWTREYMRDYLDLHTLDEASHRDYGWEQAFRVLTVGYLPLELFGDGKTWTGRNANAYLAGFTCQGAPLLHDNLADALQIVGDRADKFDLHSQPDIMFLLLRAADRTSYITTEKDVPAYEPAIDPGATTFEPHTAYGC